jgi:methyltransferase (TIGR00027 family)
MRYDTPSRTAQWVAAARGLGMLLPPEVRLVEDPYGVAFSSPRIAALLEERRPRILAALPGLKTWIAYMQVRTRLLDDAVREFVATGGDQVVLLGAGFDTRALRLPELAAATVFEIDHPATQAHKRATLERIGAVSPARYVTWDFETRPLDELPDALVAADHDPGRPTLTIWEGVTMYLTEPAIDASLRAIKTWSAPGSQLAMTYFAKARLERPSLITRAMSAVVSRFGEPWRWGWSPDELPAYLAERGLALVEDIALADAARTLLPAELARLVGDPDRRVALATAPESIAVVHR